MQIKVEKKKDYYLLSNELGKYHFSVAEFEELGEQAAKEKAASEITKKNEARFSDTTINFAKARKLGFCEYGIKDFANNLGLDIDKEYSMKEVRDKLNLKMLKEYPNECFKLFGKRVIGKFGGVKGILNNLNGDSGLFYFIVNNGFINDEVLHEFSVKVAYYSLKNFEKEFPDDNRPRKAIEAKEKFIKGEITEKELSTARSAAWSAAESAAESAAWSAESEVHNYFSKVLLELIENEKEL